MGYIIYGFVRFIFFFKQKTAYEVRISDWSSDVCSSDLPSRGDAFAADTSRPRRSAGEFSRKVGRGNGIVVGGWPEIEPESGQAMASRMLKFVDVGQQMPDKRKAKARREDFDEIHRRFDTDRDRKSVV